MKKTNGLPIYLIISCTFLFCTAFSKVNQGLIELPETQITFHEVQLVCNAAPDIGCGSRSKPILLELEKSPMIKEAWLNREGTIIAVVWEDSSEPNLEFISSVFKNHNKSAKVAKGEAHSKHLESFQDEIWYKGEKVDELSIEEAGRIANQIMNFLITEKLISGENADLMFKEVEDYIQKEFLALEDVSLLSSNEYYDGWEKEIHRIGSKFIPNNLMPQIELGSPSSPSSKKQTKCCSSASDSKKCCSQKPSCQPKSN